MERTEATVLYLRLMQSIYKAYVSEETSVRERIFHAVFVVYFIRIWRQWLHNNKVSTKHFMTQNSWEGLELNLILLIKLSLENKAENIYFFNSQINEAFFRLLRSYTGMESMIVNCSMKGFISRVHRLQLEEILMRELGDTLEFPKLLARAKHLSKPKANLTRQEIESICEDAKTYASNEARGIGMVVAEIKLELFLKKVTLDLDESGSDDSDDENETDFLETRLDTFNTQNLNVLSFDEMVVNENFNGDLETVSLQDIIISNEMSGVVLKLFCIKLQLFNLFSFYRWNFS
jgi:hypothetical protein